MKELFSPLVRTWDWVSATGGMPGQILFSCLVIILVLGATYWFSNRRIG